jgi:hypothetical protein
MLNRFALIIVSLGAVFGFLASFFTVAQSLGGGLVGLAFSILIAIIVALVAVIIVLAHDRIVSVAKKQPQELRPPTVELSMNDLVIRRVIHFPFPIPQSSSLIESYLKNQGYSKDEVASTVRYFSFFKSPTASLERDDPDQFRRVARAIVDKDKKLTKWFEEYAKKYRRSIRSTVPVEILLALQSDNQTNTRLSIECRPQLYRQLTMPEIFGPIKQSVTKEQVQIAQHECISIIERLATGLGGNVDVSPHDQSSDNSAS